MARPVLAGPGRLRELSVPDAGQQGHVTRGYTWTRRLDPVRYNPQLSAFALLIYYVTMQWVDLFIELETDRFLVRRYVKCTSAVVVF